MVICRAAVPDKEREASAELADDFGMDEQMSPLAGRQNIEFTNRQLVSLILPMLAEQLLGITVGLADSLMVATVGDAAISAVSLVDSISNLMIYIFSAMATGGAQLDTGGPGLMFIFLVNVINGMAGGRIVGIVFFVCVCFAGISSIINLYEAPVAFLQEKFKLKRVPATTVIHVLGCAVALCIQAIVSEWMDVVSIYICPLGALIAAVMFFWIGGKKFALDAVNLGARKPIGKWFYPLGKYVYCACALIALIAGAALGGIG